MDKAIRYFNEYNVKPYYRIAPYLVGIACADIYMQTKDRVNSMKDKWWKVWANCTKILTVQTEANEAMWYFNSPLATQLLEWNFGCNIEKVLLPPPPSVVGTCNFHATCNFHELVVK